MLTKKRKMEEEKPAAAEDVYLEDNHIYFYAEINRVTISKLAILLREADEYCMLTASRIRVEVVPLYLHLYTDGGYIYSAFLMMDMIRACKSPVYSVIEGATASAGTLISVVCAKRFIRPSAFMLIHQLRGEIEGKMADLTDEYTNTKALMEKCRQVYVRHTRIPAKKLENLLLHEIWLDASQALSYGLADALYE